MLRHALVLPAIILMSVSSFVACDDDGGTTTPQDDVDTSVTDTSAVDDIGVTDTSAVDDISVTDTSAVDDTSVADTNTTDTVDPGPSALEVIGFWVSNYGSTEEISDTQWGASSVAQYDNADNWAILQSPADDAWNPNKFSKNVWTEPVDGELYYCTVDYGLDTLDDALASAATADASDPATGGCGGFAWTKLSATLEVYGLWATNYQFTEDISTDSWSGSAIHRYDNDENWAIVQSPADDPYTANQFSKTVWTEPSEGSFWYCTVDYGLATLDDALASTASADDSDPANSGCGSYPWSFAYAALELTGSWTDGDGEAVEITSYMFGNSTIAEYDNGANWMVTEQADANTTYAKAVWTEPFGETWVCVVEDGLATLDDAKASTATADSSDPATGGCKGGPWAHYTAQY